jgi:hypothetical protein
MAHTTGRDVSSDDHDVRDDIYLGDPRYLVSARLDGFRAAEEATADLLDEGFPSERISVLLSEESRREYLEVHPELASTEGHVLAQTVELDEESKTLKGAGAGGLIGGTLGAAAGAIVAAGTSVLIPPLGIVVAGPLAAALAGAGAAGAAGSLIGALTGAGMSEYRARRFEELLKKGDVIVSARALTDPERTTLVRVFEAHGGELIHAEEA